MKYEVWQVVVTDLQGSETGWVENGATRSTYDVRVPEGLSDLALARRLKARANIAGWRRDNWCSAEFCWRSGSMGAYADMIPNE